MRSIHRSARICAPSITCLSLQVAQSSPPSEPSNRPSSQPSTAALTPEKSYFEASAAMHTISIAAIALTISTSSTTAYPRFVSRLPNGNAVRGVNALGHRNSAGGGALNVFGEAFKAQNTQWTSALCHTDSDGDGATNGEELGDPCCKWTGASTDNRQLGSQVSHPGVANTWTSTQLEAMRCKEDFSPEATTADAAVADAAPTTTAPPVTPRADASPQALPFNATVGVDSSASTAGSGDRDHGELPSTIDPNGLRETPPSLVPDTPTQTTNPKAKPATPKPTPMPAAGGSSSGAVQHTACMTAVVVIILTAGFVM